jgi:hypothetical protein
MVNGKKGVSIISTLVLDIWVKERESLPFHYIGTLALTLKVI